MIARILLSIFAFCIYVGTNYVSNSLSTIILGTVAGGQFINSDTAHVASIAGMQLGQNFGISSLVLLIVFGFIWWKPLRAAITGSTIAFVLASSLISPANAYYDKTDFTEAYTILPNESAFWIPDVGANKDNQAQLDSMDYLNSNKVPLKRFIVPHVKLSGSGGFFDYYVPAGRLIIVDRTTFSREWVDAHDRGTSVSKQGFPCQSKEGLNVTAGVSIGASVSEANAAKYLYIFGVLPVSGDRSNPAIIFNSVYYSRKLAEVMDDVGRKKVQTLVCNEIGKRDFDTANKEMITIMDEVTKKSTEYFASVGITLNFIGWADTFNFDKEVQESINHRYAATQQANALQLLAPYASIISTIAGADATRSFGARTDGKLPTTMTTVGMPPEINNMITNMFNGHAGK